MAFQPVTSSRDEKAAAVDVVIPARRPWVHPLKAGQTLRIVDSEGQQAVDTLFYAMTDPTERYSNTETVRRQNNLYLSAGSPIVSSEGRLMATIVADTCGRHDTSAGACSRESNTVRFGHHTAHQHACRENFILGLAEIGLEKRDIVPNINFFMNVPVDADGRLAIVDGLSEPGGYVELTADMDVYVVISNCPQINNPCNGWNPTPVRVLIWN